MSDQAPVEETPDAATEAASDEQQAVVDWEKRYNDLRPEFDRTTQEAAQYRRLIEGLNHEDPDTRQAAAEALGIEFVDTDDTPEEEDDSDDDLYADPVARRRLEAIEQRFAEQEQARQEAAEQARVDAAMAQVNEQMTGLGLSSEDDQALVLGVALQLPHTPEGLPDIQAAYDRLVARDNERMKSWASSKRGAHVSPVGTSGTQVPDLDDPEQRVAWMAAQLAERD